MGIIGKPYFLFFHKNNDSLSVDIRVSSDDTGLYYLNARYYNPKLRRFISPDNSAYLDTGSPQGLNLYAYCGNDPVSHSDPSGRFGVLTWGIGALIGIVLSSMVIGAGAQLISNAIAGKSGSELWRGVAGAALGSGVNALALCTISLTFGASLAVSALIGAGVQIGTDTIETLIRGEDVSIGETVLNFGISFATNFIGNWLGAEAIPIKSWWIKPRKFLSVFTKSYGKKLLHQTLIGAELSVIVNYMRNNDQYKYDNFVIPSHFQFYGWVSE